MARFDWAYWEQKYVAGGDECTLDFLSMQPSAPSLHRLKMQSSKLDWVEKRRNYRNQAATIAATSATGQAVLNQVERLVDAAAVITDHLKLSRALKAIAAQCLKAIDPTSIQPRDLVAIITTATTIDRLAMGLATERVEVRQENIDYSALTDEQLEAIAQGKDPSEVLK